MYEIVNDFINANIDINTYNSQYIINGYQNNYSLPDNGNYIIVVMMNTDTAWTPSYVYENYTEQATYSNINWVDFQIDFYGIYAYSQAVKLKLILSSWIASEFFQLYNCSVYKVKEIQNLSAVFDRNEYQDRYILRFSLFNNTGFTRTELGFNHLEIDLINADSVK